ncbi:hypothetical protein CDAR_179041 [Caerostris darwini]|uniref:Ribosomal protein S11 n=1 Tax=Caerostris darwini TaxID=1538125 RepID=A0AAV4P9J1_9ARAC|nr:hypothetical protein CDAR_179041 [Caerostris darwini]
MCYTKVQQRVVLSTGKGKPHKTGAVRTLGSLLSLLILQRRQCNKTPLNLQHNFHSSKCVQISSPEQKDIRFTAAFREGKFINVLFGAHGKGNPHKTGAIRSLGSLRPPIPQRRGAIKLH